MKYITGETVHAVENRRLHFALSESNLVLVNFLTMIKMPDLLKPAMNAKFIKDITR